MLQEIAGNMATKTRLKFQAAKWRKAIEKSVVSEQTTRLIDYAENEIRTIGLIINTRSGGHHMDRTGNLLSSLCWMVFFNGKKSAHGYYRDSAATETSNLHEWQTPKGIEVNGRQMAKEFISSYKPTTTKGWEICFATVAPYWGYWEEGHKNIKTGKIQKWAIMTQRFDKIQRDLTPASVSFHNYIPS